MSLRIVLIIHCKNLPFLRLDVLSLTLNLARQVRAAQLELPLIDASKQVVEHQNMPDGAVVHIVLQNHLPDALSVHSVVINYGRALRCVNQLTILATLLLVTKYILIVNCLRLLF